MAMGNPSVVSRRVHAVAVPIGSANHGSLQRACARVGVDLEFSADPARIRRASHVLMPGVGAAGHAMAGLRRSGLDRCVARLTQPVLGICLGMQLLFEHSAENDTMLLGLIPGRVERLDPSPTWPHMGWNTVTATRPNALFEPSAPAPWFYFVHGFAVRESAATLASTSFGGPLVAAVGQGNFLGTQFHPEKSGAAGRQLLSRFFQL